MPDVDVDRNLLFAVIALQNDLIDQKQLAEVCAVWALRMKDPLADLLIERGWLTEGECREVERALERKLKKHRGDVRATLGLIAGAEARDAIRSIDNPVLRNSLSSLPPSSGYVLAQTLVPATGTLNEGRYTLTRLHAEGGLGKVWLAHDKDLRREVALKEIKPNRADSTEVWRRFLKEAQITGQLEHPGIVPVYELARRKEDEQPFYTMRFIRGKTLAAAIAEFHRNRNGQPADRLELSRQLLEPYVKVCEAISYAHSRGVIHRDLKPENVVLGGFGEAVVLDWGLAKMVESPVLDREGTPARGVVIGPESETSKTVGHYGTPLYMAPEQVQGQNDLVDARTDVYALGTILFEILTGHAAFKGESLDEIYSKILTAPTPSARESESTVPRALDAVCARAMAHDRASRYGTAIELAEDIRRWVADEPVSAWREPLGTRVRRWVGRHRTLVNSIVSLLATAIVALSIAIVLVSAAKRQTQNALEKATAATKSEQAEALHARNEAATSNAVIEALVNTFRVSDPIGVEGLGIRGGSESGRTLTARDVLDRNAKWVKEKLNDQPTVQATLMDTIGDVYRSMTEYEKAERLLKSALEIRTRLHGRNHQDVAKSLLHLGWLNQDRGRLEEAEKQFRECIEMRTLLLGEEHFDTLAATRHLAILWMIEGDTERSVPAYRALLKTLSQERGESDREVALTRLCLAASLLDSGSLVEGCIESRKAMNVLLSKDDKELVFVAVGKLQTGFVWKSAKQYGMAEHDIRQGMESLQRFLGPNHAYLAFFHHEIGSIREQKGDDAHAELSYRAGLDLVRKSVGLGYPKVIATVTNLGNLLERTGRYPEARALYQELVEARRQAYGSENVWFADALVAFASTAAKCAERTVIIGRAIDCYERRS